MKNRIEFCVVVLFTFATHTHTQTHTWDLWHDRLLGDLPATLQAKRTIWLQLLVSSLASYQSVFVCVCVHRNKENNAQIFTQNGIF